jgi:hypothetical protein
MDRTVLITRCSSGSGLLGERRGSVGNRDCAAFEELAAAVPSLTRDEGGPVFREPWEARIFAITLALYQRCLHLAGMGRSAVQRDQARAGGWRSLSRRHLLRALAQRARTAPRREGRDQSREPFALSRRLGPCRTPHAPRTAD